MIRLAHWIFVPSVYARLQTRYLGYRRAGSSWLSATLACFWVAMAWIVMPPGKSAFSGDARTS